MRLKGVSDRQTAWLVVVATFFLLAGLRATNSTVQWQRKRTRTIKEEERMKRREGRRRRGRTFTNNI